MEIETAGNNVGAALGRDSRWLCTMPWPESKTWLIICFHSLRIVPETRGQSSECRVPGAPFRLSRDAYVLHATQQCAALNPKYCARRHLAWQRPCSAETPSSTSRTHGPCHSSLRRPVELVGDEFSFLHDSFTSRVERGNAPTREPYRQSSSSIGNPSLRHRLGLRSAGAHCA